MVPEVNSYIMSRIDEEEVIYRSSDAVCKAMSNTEDGDQLYANVTEFLNSLKFPGTPDHILVLKVWPTNNALAKYQSKRGLMQWHETNYNTAREVVHRSSNNNRETHRKQGLHSTNNNVTK